MREKISGASFFFVDEYVAALVLLGALGGNGVQRQRARQDQAVAAEVVDAALHRVSDAAALDVQQLAHVVHMRRELPCGVIADVAEGQVLRGKLGIIGAGLFHNLCPLNVVSLKPAYQNAVRIAIRECCFSNLYGKKQEV